MEEENKSILWALLKQVILSFYTFIPRFIPLLSLFRMIIINPPLVRWGTVGNCSCFKVSNHGEILEHPESIKTKLKHLKFVKIIITVYSRSI